MKKYIIIIGICFSLSLIGSLLTERKFKEIEKEKRNLEIELAHSRINEPVKYFTVHDTVNIADIPVSSVSTNSYKKMADKQLLKDMKIEPNRVDEQQTVVMQYLDTIRLKKKADVFRYHDEWIDCSLSLQDTTLRYSIRDSAVTIIHRIPKHHFLWWHWGTKGYDVKIRNFNPHARINHAQFIKIEKD
jgi:hypothetical protein